MKRKNVRIWIVVIILVQFLVLCSVMTNANAWKNGTSPSGTVTEDRINTWRNERDKKGNPAHYGTHDWIAEAALRAIRNDPSAQQWKDNQGKDFWDLRRINIFLIGTEAPDMGGAQLSITLNGRPVGGHKTSAKHNMRFNYYGDVSEAMVITQLNTYTEHVENALRNGDCDLAAFYMGCCSHFVADLSSWPHTISSKNVWERWNAYQESIPRPVYNSRFKCLVQDVHDRYEAGVLRYTRSQQVGSTGLFTPLVDFDVSPNGIENPRRIIISLGYKTRFDPEGTNNAMWMFHQSYTVDENDKFHTKGLSGQSSQYLEQIQESLNDGIKAVANLIDYFGHVWNTETDRRCNGCVNEKPQEKTLKLSNKLSIGIAMFIYMGMAATFFTTIMMTQLVSAMKKEESPFAVNVIKIPGV